MAKANLVQKKVKLNYRDIIQYQLLTYCFMEKIKLSDNELNCLTLLGAYGDNELSDFCSSAVEEKIFKTPQTVRNFLTKAYKLNLVSKKGNNKKKISLNNDLKVQTSGTIILDFKLVYIASEEQ
tara:strand:+ start:2073 stop:2444 length:372 start_codon:yes stop_codon:yes gene_type:complete